MSGSVVRSETGRLSIRTLSAEDGTLYIALGLQNPKGKAILNEDFSLYLAAKPGVSSQGLITAALVLTEICDGLICAVANTHPMFSSMPSSPINPH